MGFDTDKVAVWNRRTASKWLKMVKTYGCLCIRAKGCKKNEKVASHGNPSFFDSINGGMTF